jgi:uncharacterized membrane protein
MSMPSSPETAAEAEAKRQLRDSHIRSIIKAVSWRVIGTMDTFMVSFVALHFLGGGTHADTIHAAKAAGSIAGLEVFTKILLYYLHERAWSRLPLGSMRKFFGREPKP